MSEYKVQVMWKQPCEIFLDIEAEDEDEAIEIAVERVTENEIDDVHIIYSPLDEFDVDAYVIELQESTHEG
jgi:hypothetical protein